MKCELKRLMGFDVLGFIVKKHSVMVEHLRMEQGRGDARQLGAYTLPTCSLCDVFFSPLDQGLLINLEPMYLYLQRRFNA
jgi:hypothetical protein